MQAWQQAALGAACLFAFHYVFLRAASGRLGDIPSVVIRIAMSYAKCAQTSPTIGATVPSS